MVKNSDIRQKEVISIKTGRRLGYISDIEFDLAKGTIKSIVVPGPNKIKGLFGRDNDYVIPWENIKQIGEDVILVEVDERYLNNMQDSSKKNGFI
ncbi:MAG: YlmC/YmxH family sporulation protein [Clostridia bacterium]|nr:YlmC/YmxH family sporulation protein [Clostridia bacterium]